MKNSGPAGGLPYTKMADTLYAYYKYTAMGNDMATVFINLSKNGTSIGGGSLQLAASASYVHFQMPFSAASTPDSIRIDIQSSKWPVTSANIGSVLFIDHLYLFSQPLGIFENASLESKIYSYPNPVSDMLYIKSTSEFQGQTVLIYDRIGKCIQSVEIPANTNSLRIELKGLAAGMYFYEIKTSNGKVLRNKFIKD